MKDMFNTNITKSQAKDTGMAMVLILIILGFYFENLSYFKYALAGLLISMIFPMAFKYVAIVWLGVSTFMGTIMSKLILSVIFFTIVLPVALFRRLLGKDSLKLKQFKKDTSSVMITRNMTFAKEHIEKPY